LGLLRKLNVFRKDFWSGFEGFSICICLKIGILDFKESLKVGLMGSSLDENYVRLLGVRVLGC
jgi:hypothetical protein